MTRPQRSPQDRADSARQWAGYQFSRTWLAADLAEEADQARRVAMAISVAARERRSSIPVRSSASASSSSHTR